MLMVDTFKLCQIEDLSIDYYLQQRQKKSLYGTDGDRQDSDANEYFGSRRFTLMGAVAPSCRLNSSTLLNYNTYSFLV